MPVPKAAAAYIERLVKMSTYAKREDVSVTEATRRLKAGRIEGPKIDGVQYIELPEKPV